jgi:hypothetical protein
VTTLSLSPLASWLLWGGALITVTAWVILAALIPNHINDHTQDAAS